MPLMEHDKGRLSRAFQYLNSSYSGKTTQNATFQAFRKKVFGTLFALPLSGGNKMGVIKNTKENVVVMI